MADAINNRDLKLEIKSSTNKRLCTYNICTLHVHTSYANSQDRRFSFNHGGKKHIYA